MAKRATQIDKAIARLQAEIDARLQAIAVLKAQQTGRAIAVTDLAGGAYTDGEGA